MAQGTCKVEGCGKTGRLTRGCCSGHYERLRLTGDVQAHIPLRTITRYAPDARCAIDGCGNSMRGGSRGWCEKHYECWRSNGDPLYVRKLAGDDLETLEAKIDHSAGPDACHPWIGRVGPEGYGWAKKDGSWTLAHIAAWEFENGQRPADAQLDHECHNRAVREGACRPGKCEHRRCCNLKHIVLRASKAEHYAATVPWPRQNQWWLHRNNAKLTEEQVREIRELLKGGRSVSTKTDLARRFGVSTMAIWRIETGKTWTQVA